MAPVRWEQRGRVALLVLDRPAALNAISVEMLDALDERLDTVDRDPGVGALVITGTGKAFSAGADLAVLRTATPQAARAYALRGHRITARLEGSPTPVIAAINGLALGGGCELALACDLRVAGATAAFALPELSLGLLPGWGGTQRLARLTSPGFAKHVIFTGRRVSADEALRRGLVNEVHTDEDLLARALELAAALAAKPPLALAAAKGLIGGSLDGDGASGLERELDAFSLAFTTDDAREGMVAFLEKRPARFTGR